MVKAIRDVRRVLGPLDPVTESTITNAERRADLTRILAGPERASVPPTNSRQRWPRPILVGACALAVAVAVIAIVAGPFGRAAPPAYAATPPPLTYVPAADGESAGQVLLHLAERTRTQAPVPTGAYEHLARNSWDLWTEIGDQRVTSAVVASHTESWRGTDDSGRVTTAFEKPFFPSAEGREAWEHGEAPDEDAFQPRTTDFRTGEFPAMWKGQPPTPLSEFERWLTVGHPTANGPAETIVALTDLARERILSPAVRANVLAVIAGLPGLDADGGVVDRAGRRGEAFSITSDYTGLPTRYTIIIDPATGSLLGFEKTLTTDAGKLNVQVPAVIGYETYLDAEFVSDID